MYTYNIFNDMIKLRTIFDDFFDQKPGYEASREFPPVQIKEADDKITINALVPGIQTENIDIQLVDDSLVISGTKKDDYDNHPYIRKERLFGEFKKTIRLPYRVKHDEIKADLADGVLTINLSKSEDAKPKKIDIN
jgi:HSP20 family protein